MANDKIRKLIWEKSKIIIYYTNFFFQIVHGCSQVLEKCYTDEEIMETKIGQLELTRKVNMLMTILLLCK